MKPCYLLAVALCWSACLADRVTQKTEFDQYRKQKDREDATLTAFVASLACPPLVQVTLKDIGDACRTAYNETAPGGTCSPELLLNAIERFQSRAQRSFMADLIRMTHEVVYLQKDARAFDPERTRRLQMLVAVPQLPQTTFKLATSGKYGNTETEQRIRFVIDWLVANSIPREKITPPLTYNFFTGRYPVKKSELRVEDRPIPNSLESQDLDHGVWIFRVDCP